MAETGLLYNIYIRLPIILEIPVICCRCCYYCLDIYSRLLQTFNFTKCENNFVKLETNKTKNTKTLQQQQQKTALKPETYHLQMFSLFSFVILFFKLIFLNKIHIICYGLVSTVHSKMIRYLQFFFSGFL